VVDPFLANAIKLPPGTPGAVQANIANGTVTKLEVDSAVKIPTLRNVALTPPYFSWGGYPNLRQMLKTYNRGLNRRDIIGIGSPEANGSFCSSGDNSGSGPAGDSDWPVTDADCNTNTTGLIVPLGLSDCEADDSTLPKQACITKGHKVKDDDLAALERFLKSLTDPRVQCDQAPFDHPSLLVVDGHFDRDRNRNERADDKAFELPEVGAYGYYPKSGFCIPNAGDLFAPGMQARSGGKRVPLQ